LFNVELSDNVPPPLFTNRTPVPVIALFIAVVAVPLT